MGIIIMYNGDSSIVSDTMLLCDGTNGTPNLIDKYIKATVSDSELLSLGGSSTHTHGNMDYAGPSHTHSVSGTSGAHKHDQTYDVDENIETYSADHAEFTTEKHSHSSTNTSSFNHTHNVSDAGSNDPIAQTVLFLKINEKVLTPPIGTICFFDAVVEKIPTGWVVCDGDAGTPNLDTYFIKGAVLNTLGDVEDVSTHTHTTTSSTHSHGNSGATSCYHGHGNKPVDIAGESGGVGYGNYHESGVVDNSTGSHTHPIDFGGAHVHDLTISGSEADPEHVKLLPIMRIK